MLSRDMGQRRVPAPPHMITGVRMDVMQPRCTRKRPAYSGGFAAPQQYCLSRRMETGAKIGRAGEHSTCCGPRAFAASEAPEVGSGRLSKFEVGVVAPVRGVEPRGLDVGQ